MSDCTVVIAQINLTVGDISGNAAKIVETARNAKREHAADVVLFPELTLVGYPPEDLIFRPELYARVADALEQIQSIKDLPILVFGLPWQVQGHRYNAAVVVEAGNAVGWYFKQNLPNYSVFDEVRYFSEGQDPLVFEAKGVKFGVTICEDMWHQPPAMMAKEAGAQVILNLNASPYHKAKSAHREHVIRQRVEEIEIPVIYTNLVGGQDELVFDGESMVFNHQGELTHRLPAFEEQIVPVSLNVQNETVVVEAGEVNPVRSELSEIYDALVLGVRDYVNKNGFKGAVIGLSGGIDSALTLAIAVDALGAKNVEAVLMPSQYTADMSNEDAAIEADALGVKYHSIPIKPLYERFMESLGPLFEGLSMDTTEENLQARSRGVLLMAISNKTGKILLTTGNKSEMSVGYATLYGDMCGGFAPIKDVPKMLVYALSEYRNTISPVIPERVITRPPSAELRPDQKDQDSLPAYEVLDPILERYIEMDQSVPEIVAAGFDMATVQQIARLVDRNEYKRRQAAPGVRITQRAFGRDRRYPITSGFSRQSHL